MERRPPRLRGRIERVLIVAKTHMANGICVSGLTAANKSIRLLTAHRNHQPNDTPYEVGQVWQVEYKPMPNIRPPHVEDVRILHADYLGQQPHMRQTLLSRIRPWQGDPRNLYNGYLVFSPRRSAYISRSGGIPDRSTWFWLPERPLTLCQIEQRAYYEIAYDLDGGRAATLRIRFVGCAEAVPELPAGTLVRVSLARWWKQYDADEERCYLQLSGWYQ